MNPFMSNANQVISKRATSRTTGKKMTENEKLAAEIKELGDKIAALLDELYSLGGMSCEK